MYFESIEVVFTHPFTAFLYPVDTPQSQEELQQLWP